MRPLITTDCKGTCRWSRAQENGQPVELDDFPLFRCGSCGSEWTPQQSWTPREADGSVTDDIAATRQLGLTDDERAQALQIGVGSVGTW